MQTGIDPDALNVFVCPVQRQSPLDNLASPHDGARNDPHVCPHISFEPKAVKICRSGPHVQVLGKECVAGPGVLLQVRDDRSKVKRPLGDASYFGINTVCFRGGCLTGPCHRGAQLHGFLSYLMKCAATGQLYTIFGYGGKQVRDNIHAYDLVNMFWHYHQNPRAGEVYNAGGGRPSHCSVLEAIALCEQLTGRRLNTAYSEDNRIGDHMWYVSDMRKFQSHYPEWSCRYDLRTTLAQIHEALSVTV